MQKCILLTILFLLGIGKAFSTDIPPTDTIVIDSNAIKKSGFRRMYESVYRYFQESNADKEEKRFDFSIIGGPHYSSDTKLGLGLVASGLYRIDRTDRSIQPSNVSFYGDVTTTGFYLLGIRGNTIFPQDKYRLNVNVYFFSFPSKYWGVGYENGSRNDDYTTYKRLENQIRIDFSRKIATNTYFGVTTLYRHVNGKDFKDIQFLNGEKRNVTVLGFGLQFTYDSRDFIPNPYKGMYATLQQMSFPDFFGNKFQKTEFNFRKYNRVWKGGILAYDLQGIFQYGGDTPWSMMAVLGGPYQMRGYYEGQYRDNDLIQTQLELRQHIYNRHSIALWAGAGNVFPDFKKFDWGHTLPTYGVGYRWEFKKRVNVRLDYGIGKGQTGFYFNINEAF